MSSVQERVPAEFDWDAHEREFDDGGDFDGGNDGGDDGDHLPDRPERDWRRLRVTFGLIGAAIGSNVSYAIVEELNQEAADRYIAKHNIVVTPSNHSAVEQGVYDGVANRDLDFGIVTVAMFACVAVGVAVARRMERNSKKDN